jgi:XTP/dITP diphosphohydrolase
VKVLLASTNPNKLSELRAALPDWSIDRLDYAVDESGETFRENAAAKALGGRAVAPGDAWILGEDSGLEVDGLDGRPGLLSARYAGPGEDPVEKLLAELAPVTGEGRRARYVCELVLVPPEGEAVNATGVLEGRIAHAPRGDEGFGYDPVFVPAGEELTVAELGNRWKGANSHRARAAAALRDRVVRFRA